MRNLTLVCAVVVLTSWLASTADAGHRHCRTCGGGGYGYAASYGGSYYGGSYAAAYAPATLGYGGYPTGTYATRATYGYGYYRPYGAYYGPHQYSYSYGAYPAPTSYAPGYLPPRYYGGVGYWGGRGSSYYYGGGVRPSVGMRF